MYKLVFELRSLNFYDSLYNAFIFLAGTDNYSIMSRNADQVDAFRAALVAGVAATIKDAGFTDVEQNALESIVEMAQSFTLQLAKSAKHFAELANRSQVRSLDRQSYRCLPSCFTTYHD